MAVSSTEDFDPRALAARLHGLQKAGKEAPTADFVLPGTLRDAMDAQNFLAAEERISTAAWKVAMSPDGHPVTAPLNPYFEASSGATIGWQPGMKFEAEVAVRLGKDLPVRTDGIYTRAEIADAISEAYLGAELLASSIEEAGALSFLLFLADRIGNRGYVLGPTLPKSVIDTITNTPIRVTLNGQPIYDGPAQHPKGDVLVWLLDYANDKVRPHTSLRSGALITTGTLCGAIELTSQGDMEIVLGEGTHLSFSVA
ncbi:fumarylacetoacetate hydrolase family protein [Rhizobium sp. Root1220]|uniref:fumarylacetoacetate hydrolase family protein n=1 Tax=Rhizobium sp. Root1220 TaxID=1736432 RepID=UPI0006F39520|nr:fumarylacetoacetate hydrolase family protein [Rhizobium sp. Root1220]KQV65249.1 2-keto-4-pentenoate hydratase [Rhizobium sp. Root1220]